MWGLRDSSPQPEGRDGEASAGPNEDQLMDAGEVASSRGESGGPYDAGPTNSVSDAATLEPVGTSGSIISNGRSSTEPAEKDGVAAEGHICSPSDPVAQAQVQPSSVISSGAARGVEPTAPTDSIGTTPARAVVSAPATSGGVEPGVATSSAPAEAVSPGEAAYPVGGSGSTIPASAGAGTGELGPPSLSAMQVDDCSSAASDSTAVMPPSSSAPVIGAVTGGWAPTAGTPFSAAPAVAAGPAVWAPNPVTPAAGGWFPAAVQVCWTPAPAMPAANGWAPTAGTLIGTAPAVATGPVGWTPTFVSSGAAIAAGGPEGPAATQMQTDEDFPDDSPVAMDCESTDEATTPTRKGADDAAMSDALRSVARPKMSPTKTRSLPRLRLPAPAYSPKVVRALKLREARLRRQRGVELVSGPAMLGATAPPAKDVEMPPVPNASQESGETEEKVPISDGSRKRCRTGEDEDCGSAGFAEIRVQPSGGPPGKRPRMAESCCVRSGSARTRSALNPTIAWALKQRRTRNLRGSSQVVRPVVGLPDSPSNFWDRADLRSVSTTVVDTIRARADRIALSSRSSASREVVLKPGTKRVVAGVEDPVEPPQKRRRRW